MKYAVLMLTMCLLGSTAQAQNPNSKIVARGATGKFSVELRRVNPPIVDQGLRATAATASCCKPVICRTIRIEDPENISPCAVPTKITVCDPYTCKEVTLTVCMPPQAAKSCCRPVKIVRAEISRRGRKVKYDHGKYEVEIHFSRRGILIDYDD